MVIVMLGAPGTGKGTISTLLSKYYDIPHISVGDILREAIAKGDKNSDMIKDYMSKGLLLPDELIVKAVEKRLKMLDCSEGFIIDGFPRTVEQADSFYGMLKRLKKTLTCAVELELTTDEIIERITNRIVCPNCKAIYNKKIAKPITEGICDNCDSQLVKRVDDTEEQVIERLKEYKEKTYGLVEYYSKTGKLFTVLVSTRLGKQSKDVLKEIVWYIEGKSND